MNAANLLDAAPLESARFDYRIGRGLLGEVDDRALLKEIIARELDIAIVRAPAGRCANLQRLSRYGMSPIHADTLVYYELSFPRHQPQALRNQDLNFSPATVEDRDELMALVQTTFDGYISHYHANPMLPADKILAGYAEWATGYLGGDTPEKMTWVARRDSKLVAFACCSTDAAGKMCEGVLYGVHPEHAGGGLYGDLIRYTQAQFLAMGFDCMKVSTQVWNYAVQKVWVREGFSPKQAFDTFHINAMLSAGHLLVDRALVFSEDQVARFAEATGDTNPVHLDHAAARRAGFESRITHGMLAGGEMSRIFGTEIPGPGTLFLRSDLVFLKPIYAGVAHTLQMRYPSTLPLAGHVRAIATIRNPAGELCLLGYNDLLIRS